MGLDGVELVMAWEEAFGITIADEEAVKIRTPRMTIDLIHAKLGGLLRGDARCLTQRCFYLLRRHFLPLTTMPRKSITPKARLVDLVPKHNGSYGMIFNAPWSSLPCRGLTVPHGADVCSKGCF